MYAATPCTPSSRTPLCTRASLGVINGWIRDYQEAPPGLVYQVIDEMMSKLQYCPAMKRRQLPVPVLGASSLASRGETGEWSANGGVRLVVRTTALYCAALGAATKCISRPRGTYSSTSQTVPVPEAHQRFTSLTDVSGLWSSTQRTDEAIVILIVLATGCLIYPCK